MRRILSGLALALVAIGTVTGPARSAEPTVDTQIGYMEGTGVTGLFHGFRTGYMLTTTSGDFQVIAPVGRLLRACETQRCRDAIMAQHEWLKETYYKRHRVFEALRGELPACASGTDPGPCYWDGDASNIHKFLILDGVDYFYSIG